VGGGEQLVGVKVGDVCGLPLLGELEGAAIVLDGLDDLVVCEEGVAKGLVGEGGIALRHGVVGIVVELLVEEIARLAERGGVGLLEVGVGQIALGLDISGIGSGEGAAKGEGALLVDGALGIVVGPLEGGEVGEEERQVTLGEGAGVGLVQSFCEFEGGGEGLFGLRLEAELALDCRKAGHGGALEALMAGLGGEVVGVAGEGEGFLRPTGGGEDRSEVLVVSGAGVERSGVGFEQLAGFGVVFVGVG